MLLTLNLNNWTEHFEPSLFQDIDDVRLEVSRKLRYSTVFGDLSELEQDDVDRIVDMGLRRFYFPPVIPGEKKAHEWSFLYVTTTLATAANDYTYDLPDDFGGL